MSVIGVFVLTVAVADSPAMSSCHNGTIDRTQEPNRSIGLTEYCFIHRVYCLAESILSVRHVFSCFCWPNSADASLISPPPEGQEFYDFFLVVALNMTTFLVRHSPAGSSLWAHLPRAVFVRFSLGGVRVSTGYDLSLIHI